MVRHFEEELNDLKKKLLAMGKLVEAMISKSIRAILEQNKELQENVIAHEDAVNKCQIEIDDICITMIALQQPAAADLRFITSAMKINSDLERMGDQAVNITDHPVESAALVPKAAKDIIAGMADKVNVMVRSSLDAFVKKDTVLAQKVLESDDEVDSAKEKVYGELTDCMKQAPEKLKPSLDLLLISRNLERIGDHATNIAEDVIYMVAGKDIRHHILDHR